MNATVKIQKILFKHNKSAPYAAALSAPRIYEYHFHMNERRGGQMDDWWLKRTAGNYHKDIDMQNRACFKILLRWFFFGQYYFYIRFYPLILSLIGLPTFTIGHNIAMAKNEDVNRWPICITL